MQLKFTTILLAQKKSRIIDWVMHRLKYILIGLLTLVIYGCKTTGPYYEIEVSAFGSIQGILEFTIVPSKQLHTFNELEFSEYASILRRVLERKGYRFDESNPELIIEMAYGISEPITGETSKRIPVYKTVTYVQKAQNNQNSNETYNTTTSGTYTSDFQGNVHYNETQTTTKSTGAQFIPADVPVSRTELSGYENVTEKYTYYERILNLSAFNTKKGGNNLIWTIECKSTGSSNDLRKVMRALMFAASDYVGISSGSKVEVSIPTSDVRLEQL